MSETLNLVGGKSLFKAISGKKNADDCREKHDFYPTPPEPIRAFLAAEMSRLKQFPTLWEAAAGDGAMANEMEFYGFDVCKSDLIDRGCNAQIQSFYDFKQPLSEAIVTNPPFKECNADKGWIRYALDILKVEYMALLLPFNWAGSSEKRVNLWRDHTPARIYLIRWRIDFTGGGASPVLNAWYVWDKAHKGETIFRTLDKSDKPEAAQ